MAGTGASAVPRRERVYRSLALVSATAIVALAIVALGFEIPLRHVPIQGFVERFGLYRLVAALAFALLGAALAHSRPRNTLGWIFLIVGACNALSLAAEQYGLSTVWHQTHLPGAPWLLWIGEWVQFPGYWLLPTLPILLFPDGHLPSPRWRPAAVGAVVAAACTPVGWALLSTADTDIHTHPPGFVSPAPTWGGAGAIQGLASLVGLVAVVAAVTSLALRFRAARGAERAQLRLVAWGAAGMVALLIGALIEPGPGGWSLALSSLPLPIAITFAIVRHRRWVVHQLADRLEAASDENPVRNAVETLARALRLQYAAVSVDGAVVAAIGDAGADTTATVPLVYGGEEVGTLMVAWPTGDVLTASSQRTLAELVRPLGVVVHAQTLAGDLRRSRDELVRAREEERRQLRRDLHDGLGPTLAAMALQAERSRALVASDPAAADALLGELAAAIRDSVAIVRTLAAGLRVADLDDHGLAAALTHLAERFCTAGLDARVTVDPRVTEAALPAAVEVAAYRIAGEALTNVARHAHADSCTVELARVNGSLALRVEDHGRGLPAQYRHGIGLRSMEQRARELGGTLVVRGNAHGGTTVEAELPVQTPGDDA